MVTNVENVQKEDSEALQGNHFRWRCSRTMSFEDDAEKAMCTSGECSKQRKGGNENIPSCTWYSWMDTMAGAESEMRCRRVRSPRNFRSTPKPGLCCLPRVKKSKL